MKAIAFSKWLSLAILILAIFCFWPDYRLYYLCGYYQKPITLILYKELLEFSGHIFLLPCLFILWIVGLVRKKHRLWQTIIFGTSLILARINYISPSPHDYILYGLRDGMLQNYGPDEMRSFAREFDKLPKIPKNDVDGQTKLYWNRLKDDDLPKTGLKEKYPFIANCEAVVEYDNKVHIDWGGFENHWGFSVSVDGKRIDAPHSERSNRTIRASDDIYFTSDY